ncbi:MAG: hypothetical protein ACXADX_15765 [Candidatus Hodarchaeales archaeon]
MTGLVGSELPREQVVRVIWVAKRAGHRPKTKHEHIVAILETPDKGR